MKNGHKNFKNIQVIRYAALKGQYDQAFGLMAPRESEKN